MVYAQLRTRPGKTSLGFSYTIGSPNLGQTTRPSDSKKKKKKKKKKEKRKEKKRTCQIVDFPILGDHRVKLKESEKRDKYRDLA